MVDSTKLPNIDINAIVTDLNNKMDRDGVNTNIPVVISRTPNAQGGVVEIWSDGYCVQSGKYSGGNQIITLTQAYRDTAYNIFTSSSLRGDINWNGNPITAHAESISTFRVATYGDYTNIQNAMWRTEGYIR